MKKEEAIEFLENLQQGEFLTVVFPIIADKKIRITSMYVGKDEEGRYRLIDKSGDFIVSKKFIEKGEIAIEKEYDRDVAFDIYTEVKRKQERMNKTKKHNRDFR